MILRKTLKLLTCSLILSFSIFIFAEDSSPTPPLCKLINGTYSGTYVDPTGLFPSIPFPINMYLMYQKNMIYGFTLPSDDQKGARYGQKPFHLIWGTCSHNTITDLYVIPKRKNTCGDPAAGPMPLNADGALLLTLNYENAMTGASLKATLNPSKTPTSTETLSTSKQKELLNRALEVSKNGISTCH